MTSPRRANITGEAGAELSTLGSIARRLSFWNDSHKLKRTSPLASLYSFLSVCLTLCISLPLLLSHQLHLCVCVSVGWMVVVVWGLFVYVCGAGGMELCLCVYVDLSKCVYVWVCACVRVCGHAWVCAGLCVCTYVTKCVCMRVCLLLTHIFPLCLSIYLSLSRSIWRQFPAIVQSAFEQYLP